MSREIVEFLWCDRHETKVQAKTLGPFEVEGRRLFVDLCDECAAEFVDPLAKILAEFGSPGRSDEHPRSSGRQPRRQSPSERGEAALPCLWCSAVLSSSPAFNNHVRDHHGVTSRIGKTTPNYGDIFPPQCPLCGNPASSVVGLGSHISATHGDVTSAELPSAFKAALDAGDRFGVVARTIERVNALTATPT